MTAKGNSSKVSAWFPSPRNMPDERVRLRDWCANWLAPHLTSLLGMDILKDVTDTGNESVLVPDDLLGRPHTEIGEELARRERQRVEKAELYFVTRDMTAVAIGAGRQLPAYDLDYRHLPSPYGFLIWQAPIAVAAQSGEFPTITAPIDIVAATWGVVPDGVWVTFWTSAEQVYAAGANVFASAAQMEKIRVSQGSPELIFERELSMQFGACEWEEIGLTRKGILKVVEEVDLAAPDVADTAHLRGTILATWKLMSQKISLTRRVEPSRQRRRALTRMKDPLPSDVRLVALRRSDSYDQKDVPRDSGSGWHYSHRFRVSGHWRNQYYPSTENHEQIYISDYIKGPEGTPLIVKENVNILRR